MTTFSWRSAALAPIALASIAHCSSSSSSAGPDSALDASGSADAAGSPDAGGGTDAPVVTDAPAGMEAAPTSCDASVLPPPDAGGACNACVTTGCMTELAACASDCTCGPVEACLELTNANNYPGCPGGLAAISSGQVPLMNIAGCVAMKCQGPCFSREAGGD